jgi:hypothetical protein
MTALGVGLVHGKENSDGKPIVYNYITKKDPDPADEAVTKKVYAAKYHIVDLPRDQVIHPIETKKTSGGKATTGCFR